MTEKEYLAVLFGLEKFRPYLIGSHVNIYTNNYAFKNIFSKKDANAGWILLLQEYDCDIIDKKGFENPMTNHLSRFIYTESLNPIFWMFP